MFIHQLSLRLFCPCPGGDELTSNDHKQYHNSWNEFPFNTRNNNNNNKFIAIHIIHEDKGSNVEKHYVWSE